MAIRHVKEYYKKMTEQYLEMQENIVDIEKEVSQGMIDPEFLDNLKEQIKPIKDNYLTLSYIMFLFNKPNRERKISKYLQKNKKLLEKIPFENTMDGKISQNVKVLGELKDFSVDNKQNNNEEEF